MYGSRVASRRSGRHGIHIMTIGQLFNQRPAKALRRWRRKARVLARKAAHEERAQYILTQRIWSVLLFLFVIALGLLASAPLRHWFTTSFVNIAIVGGIIAAPVISVVAWVGVALPVRAPLHQAAPTLFIGALLWMTMAFISAHARREGATGH